MKFTKGKVVIHPHHGPSTVEKVGMRKIRGERTPYLTLMVHGGDLSVSLPEERANDIGIRAVVDADGVKEIFDVLLSESQPHDRVWSRRFKAYTERLHSGDINIIAGLIRDLSRRNEERRISYGEMGILKEAIERVTAELSLAMKVPAEELEDVVQTAALEGVVPELAA